MVAPLGPPASPAIPNGARPRSGAHHRFCPCGSPCARVPHVARLPRPPLSALLLPADLFVRDYDVSGSTSPPWTVRRVLEWTTSHLQKHGSETPRLDAEVLLAHARGCRRIQLYTEYDAELPEAVRARMRELVQRRAQLEPVAYLVGHREFFSLDLVVTPAVLIPRPETETLVIEVLAIAKTLPRPHILDLCTGSGCVAIAVARNCPGARVTATDRSPAALEVARTNVQKHRLDEQITLCCGDLFAAVADPERFNIVVSNPPYVPTGEIAGLSADVRGFEPKEALDGGTDGLDVIRRIVAEAPRRLTSPGWLLLELSPEQAPAVRQIATETGCYTEIDLIKDLSGHYRVLRARHTGGGETGP